MLYGFFPRLLEFTPTKAGYLSGGEQQMLATGRASMTHPKLLMLAEPSLGPSPKLVQEIFAIIREINQETKTSILLVEQNAAADLELVDLAYLIDNGQIDKNG